MAKMAMMVILGAALVTASEARAETCASDAARLCQGIQKGEGRVLACLEDHRSELSKGCIHEIAQTRKAAQVFLQACGGDATALCPKVKQGQGRVVKCLKGQPAGKVSPACAKALGAVEVPR